MAWATFWFLILYSPLPLGTELCLIVDFSSFSLPFCSFLQFCYHFLPFHSAIPTVMLFDPSLLSLFGPTAYSSLNDSIWSFGLCITLLVGSFVPFISSYASLAHLLSLGFLGHFSNFAFPWAFTNSFGFLVQLPYPSSLGLIGLSSTPYFLCLHYFGLAVAHSHFSTSHTAHGFAISLFPGSFRPICFLKTHLFISWVYNPLFLLLGFNGFSIHLPTLFCPCYWASFFYWASQNKHQQLLRLSYHFYVISIGLLAKDQTTKYKHINIA